MEPSASHELISAYLDGELSADECAAVQQMLREDSAARALLGELRSMQSSIRELPQLRLEEDFPEVILGQPPHRAVAAGNGAAHANPITTNKTSAPQRNGAPASRPDSPSRNGSQKTSAAAPERRRERWTPSRRTVCAVASAAVLLFTVTLLHDRWPAPKPEPETDRSVSDKSIPNDESGWVEAPRQLAQNHREEAAPPPAPTAEEQQPPKALKELAEAGVGSQAEEKGSAKKPPTAPKDFANNAGQAARRLRGELNAKRATESEERELAVTADAVQLQNAGAAAPPQALKNPGESLAKIGAGANEALVVCDVNAQPAKVFSQFEAALRRRKITLHTDAPDRGGFALPGDKNKSRDGAEVAASNGDQVRMYYLQTTPAQLAGTLEDMAQLPNARVTVSHPFAPTGEALASLGLADPQLKGAGAASPPANFRFGAAARFKGGGLPNKEVAPEKADLIRQFNRRETKASNSSRPTPSFQGYAQSLEIAPPAPATRSSGKDVTKDEESDRSAQKQAQNKTQAPSPDAAASAEANARAVFIFRVRQQPAAGLPPTRE